MKKNLMFLTAFLAVLFLVQAGFCLAGALQGDIAAAGANFVFMSVKSSQSTNDYTLKVSYPQISSFTKKQEAANFNKAVKGYIEENVKQFKNELKKKTRPQKWDMTVEAVVKFQTADMASLLISGSTFQGGAHPIPIVHTVNFDFKSGRVLELKDLFMPKSEYLKNISQYCIKKLSAAKVADADFINSGAAPKKENYENFYLSKEGLVIVFPPAQVAPYYKGTQEIIIPYKDLKFFDINYLPQTINKAEKI